MKHSLEFFRDEINNGFYVPTQVKIAWATSLDVLSEIDRICKKYNIIYFADWGTILGAVRHGGFVPWDDDLDICMLRADYCRFREVADAELPEQYCIHDYERQEDHWLFLSRVVNRRHISFDENDLSKNYNYPWLTGIDIFIKDYLYPEPEKEKERCDEILRIIAVADGITENSMNPASINSELKSICRKYSVTLPSINDRRRLSIALYALAEKQMARVPKSDAKEIGQIFPFILKGYKGEPKELYETIVRLPFEDTTIPVPSQYNKALASRYGNYNEIRKVWSGHTYPAFEGQKALFEESSKVSLPHFTYNPKAAKRTSVDTSGSLKTMAKECLQGLNALYTDSCNILSEADSYIDLLGCLEKMQQLAVDLGTLIENVKGEKNPHTVAIVSVLETLCEDIYTCSQAMEDYETLSDYLTSIESTLSKLETSLADHLLKRREVLFLPIGTKEWTTLSKIYWRVANESDVDTVVVPLPLFTKDYFGRPTMSMEKIREQASFDMYPKDLPLYNWGNYDLALHCPEVIYIQFPYDGENPYLSIPQAYYAQNLRQYTEELIYVTIGQTSEFGINDVTDQSNLKYYVTAPAIIYADRVLVQSENIKKQYIHALSEFAGDDTLKMWQARIQADPSPFETAQNTDNSYHKRLLYCISLYEFTEHIDNFEEIIDGRLITLTGSSDKVSVSLCFYPKEFNCSDPTLLNRINTLREQICLNAKERGIEAIPLPCENLFSFVGEFDAYYGSSSPLVHIFTEQKKPVMISNYDI